VNVSAELEQALRSWVAEEVGDPDTVVTGVRRTSAGFSRENWVFEASWTTGGKTERHQLIARRDPPGSVLNTDRRIETGVLRALEPTTVPTPRLRWADLTGERLGRPAIVMDLVDGVCDGFILSAGRPVEERLEIAHRLYDRLSDIHLVDWRALGLGDLLDDPGPAAAESAVAHWEKELRGVQLGPEPELELIIDWLRRHAPVAATTAIVHGDFKAGNVLLVDDDVSAVLDWETVHLGDPHEDLGWVTNPLRAREHTIPGVWEPADLLERWSRQTGLPVDLDAVRWWSVLANVKLAVIVLSGQHAFIAGRLDRVHQTPVQIYRLLLDMIGA
jgi:aminoglycoside phosphotransferase (APT) family kinase protein